MDLIGELGRVDLISKVNLIGELGRVNLISRVDMIGELSRVDLTSKVDLTRGIGQSGSGHQSGTRCEVDRVRASWNQLQEWLRPL